MIVDQSVYSKQKRKFRGKKFWYIFCFKKKRKQNVDWDSSLLLVDLLDYLRERQEQKWNEGPTFFQKYVYFWYSFRYKIFLSKILLISIFLKNFIESFVVHHLRYCQLSRTATPILQKISFACSWENQELHLNRNRSFSLKHTTRGV